MGLILDTSILIAWERSREGLQALGSQHADDSVAISIITAAELLHGVHRADTPAHRHRRGAFVEQVLSQFPILEFDLTIARIYADLWADLDRQGRRLSAHDMIIGATALASGHSVVTLNKRDFGHIPGLSLQILKSA